MAVPADLSAQDAILDAAEALFAQKGFRGATIKEIGARAGVNSALLYYYYDDKQTLYRAAIRRLVEALVREGTRRLAPGLPPAEAIRRVVAAQVEFLAAHPAMPKLLVRELVEHEAAHAEESITHLAATLFQRICDVIREGQRRGEFRPDLDPRFAAISTIAQVAYLFIARPAVGLLLGHGPAGPPPEEIQAFGRHAGEFAVAALRTGPPSDEGASP